MNVDLSTLTFKDGILVGILIAQWFNARGRRDQGIRLGKLEKLAAKHFGLDEDDESKPRRVT